MLILYSALYNYSTHRADRGADRRVNEEEVMAKDPVCGMNVDEKQASTVVHGGKTYYFCSAGCKATFEKAPAKYART